jgi:hypothetical protein
LVPETLAVTAQLGRHTESAIRIYQRNSTDVTLAGFRKKVLQVLRGADHIATETVADAILGCTVGAAPAGLDRAKFLERALSQFRTAEVSHFFVLPNSAITDPIRFDGYRLGEIDLPVVSSRCRRAQSDYADLYTEQLRGRYCVQSPDFRHVVIDYLKIGYDSGLLGGGSWGRLLLNYFTRIARLHFEYMWEHLNRTQILAASFEAQIMDVHNVRSTLGMFASRITIYLEFSRIDSGYVLPEGAGVNVNQPGSDSEALMRFFEHRKNLRTSEVGDSELGRTILICAGFCQQAIRFLEAGRVDDAALYATICLENVFSEKSSTSNSVCARTSATTFRRLAAAYGDAERELRKLYDARSAFVHSGKPVTPPQAERLIEYARETVRSLLVLHFKPENRATGFLDKWIKNLDFIVSGFEAGRTFDVKFLEDHGILGA